MGHRVGKQEGSIRKEQLDQLNPQKQIDVEIGNISQIRYTIDLTREYHNLLMREEEQRTQTYFWDGNVTSYEENGRQSYYLQDELGSPLRIEDELGAIKESYGYGAFGEDLYGNQGEMQPFGYTGYQRDSIAGTYFAQAREYKESYGRFNSRDYIKGTFTEPISFNEYVYCYNNSFSYIDLNGLWITAVIGGAVGGIFGGISQVVTDIVTGEKPSFKKTISAMVGGIVGGAMAGTGVGAAYAGAASGAASNLVEGIWDIADGTTTFSAKSVIKLGASTLWEGGKGAALGGVLAKFAGKFTSKISGKLVDKLKLRQWKFKYEYADKRIRTGAFSVLKSLKLNGGKFLAVESTEKLPDLVLDTLVNIAEGWGKQIGKQIDVNEVLEYIQTNLQDLWEGLKQIKNESISCPI